MTISPPDECLSDSSGMSPKGGVHINSNAKISVILKVPVLPFVFRSERTVFALRLVNPRQIGYPLFYYKLISDIIHL